MVTLLNNWSAAWGPYFLLAVLQNTVFLALVFGVLHGLRHRPARVLAGVATVGVVKLAVPPFLAVGWLGTAPAEQMAQPVSTLLFPFADLGAGTESSSVGLPGGLSPLTVLMALWASVALTRLGFGLVQTLQLSLKIRGAHRLPDAEVPAEVLNAGLTVWVSPRIPLPLTLGLRPRRIFVPASWNTWPAASRQAVLRHELAHVQRWDGLVQALEILVQALFFFLPPVTWLVRRLHTYREMACDDASVAADPAARLAYSRFLCTLAESILEMPPTTASASALARRRCELVDRVSYQVKEGVMNTMTRKKLLGILAVLALSALPLSLVYGVGAQAPPPPPPAPATGEEIHVPADAPDVKDVPPPPPLSIRVTLSDKQIGVSGVPIQSSELKQALKLAVEEKGAKSVVSIDSKGDVTMKQLHSVQRDLQDLGLVKVIYTGELGESVPMVLPPDKAKEKLKNLDPEFIVHVKVDGQGVVTIANEKVHGAQVSKVIAKAMQENTYRIVVLHTDADTKYGAFVQVLREVKVGGADKIAIADPE